VAERRDLTLFSTKRRAGYIRLFDLHGILRYKLFQTQAPKVDISVNIRVVLRLGVVSFGDHLVVGSNDAVQDSERIGRFNRWLCPKLITKGRAIDVP
jgi:hypothetical protein